MVCCGTQQLETDPLLENLDELLPLTLDMPSVGSVPTTLPSAVEELCAALTREPGIDDVSVGRQVSHFGMPLPHASWFAVNDIAVSTQRT